MNLTDNDVVKALECCVSPDVITCKDSDCPFINHCKKDGDALEKASLDLINRQKAEIERLEGILDKRCDVCPAVITKIKEFAERLKQGHPGDLLVISFAALDKIADEVIGGE